jgi:NAD(P)-dependent dehydrogenase (short-subunit alcohol dehydrogenase family)
LRYRNAIELISGDRFSGKVLIATGGGSGLAAATARRYASEGGRVAVLDLDAARAQAVSGELEGSIALACDVSDEDSVQAAFEATQDQLGRIDCVFNAAGHVHFAALEELSLAEWNKMIAVHLTGTFLACRAALPALRAAGGGSIVNVASTAGLRARPKLAAYAAAKGGIIGFSRQLALDAAADGIRVNVVAPGSIRTPLTDAVYGEHGRPSSILGRVGEPEEIAATVCFLVSDDSSFYTGSVFTPDGGQTAL